MLKTIAVIALLAVASGCTTLSAEDRRSADEAQCRGYGFKRGTTAFAECLQRIDLDRRAERRDWLRGDAWGGRYGPYGRVY